MVNRFRLLWHALHWQHRLIAPSNPETKGGRGESPERPSGGFGISRASAPSSERWRGLAVCERQPALAMANWLEELAVFGAARNPLDAEISYQLSLVVENLYLVRLALNR